MQRQFDLITTKSSKRFNHLKCYPDGRVFCTRKNDFLTPVDNMNKPFPYYNIMGQRVYCKIVIAEAFLTDVRIKRNEIVINVDGDDDNYASDNLEIVPRSQVRMNIRKKKKVVEEVEFFNWNETAIYC